MGWAGVAAASVTRYSWQKAKGYNTLSTLIVRALHGGNTVGRTGGWLFIPIFHAMVIACTASASAVPCANYPRQRTDSRQGVTRCIADGHNSNLSITRPLPPQLSTRKCRALVWRSKNHCDRLTALLWLAIDKSATRESRNWVITENEGYNFIDKVSKYFF